MPSRTADLFSTIHAEGGLFTPEFLQLVLDQSKEIEHTTPESYRYPGMKLNEVINQEWNVLNRSWQRFASGAGEQGYLFDMLNEGEGVLPARDDADPGPLEGLTRQRWLMPLFQALDYGGLSFQRQLVVGDRTYPVSHLVHHVPIHLVGASSHLDRRPARAPRSASDNVVRTSPHATVQELLNRSDQHLWGFVGNGLRLRLLRDNVSLVRQAYVEFDLHAMMKGQAYPDFKLLWLLCHESRLHAERAEQSIMEQWRNVALQRGARALEKLRDGVERAINTLGSGFLKATTSEGNQRLRQRLKSGELNKQEYYRQVLRLVYRMLFLFVVEDRQLLFRHDVPGETRQIYQDYYSTRHLREIASRPRGSQHPDLWRGLRLVFRALGRDDGCPELGLPGLGSFLFSDHAMPDLENADVSNRTLLSAIHHLAYVQDKHGRTPVNFTVLNEELGSVYESLLELQPDVDADAGTFRLVHAAGSERKTTGSYYTPPALVQNLLDTALDPVLDEAAKGTRPDDEGTTAENRILDLKVCDPACGSGHFLVAAAHRLAHRLASVRTGDEAPDPETYRHALRDVIQHCIYGVDVNEMAVELCRCHLWLESHTPDKPLTFLEHHIQHGNSLLGATPALLAQGIPDEAFKPIEGDVKDVCNELKKENRRQRKDFEQGQGHLFRPWIQMAEVAGFLTRLTRMEEQGVPDVNEKRRLWDERIRSSGYAHASFAADAWCAAFVWRKDRSDLGEQAITDATWRAICKSGRHAVTQPICDYIARLAEQYGFFHWHLAFPDVFSAPDDDQELEHEQTGWSGGFDVVLGNPPWERIKLEEKEWFAQRSPDIINAPNAATRKAVIEKLKEQDPSLHQAFLDAKREHEGMSTLVRNTGRYPLCGRGDVNTYAIFAELDRALMSPTGRAGFIVPSGIATDSTTQYFFQNLIKQRSLVSDYSFENESLIFAGVHHATKFCLLTLTGTDRPHNQAEFVFFARGVDALTEDDRRFTLSAEDIELLNPNTRTCPIFRSKRDAELTKHIYRRVPVLIREARNGQPEQNPWYIKLTTAFHMSNDSHLFHTRANLESEGCTLHGNIFDKDDRQYLPLYEAKMIWHFDHRFGTYEGQTQAQENQGKLPELDAGQHANPDCLALPRYWLSATDAAQRVPSESDYLVGFRDVTSSVVWRTSIFTLLPPVPCGNNLPLCSFAARHAAERDLVASCCSSLAFDFITRQKLSGSHMNFFILKQLPVLSPSDFNLFGSPGTMEWIRRRHLELYFTAWDMTSFAGACGYDGPPFVWDEERRFQIRCELDAAYFHLYLGTPDEWQQQASNELKAHFSAPRAAVAYILDTFPIVKRKDEQAHGHYRTKDTILAIYDQMVDAIRTGVAYQSQLDPPPGPSADEQGNFIPMAEWDDGIWQRYEGVIHPPLEDRGTPVQPTAPAVAVPTDEPEADRILAAFREVREGRSPDYVVASPEVNALFLEAVRDHGVRAEATLINQTLLNARKAGKLAGEPTEQQYRLPRELRPYVFVCEWALKHLQRLLEPELSRLVTLDELLCNPAWAARFDELAAKVKSEFSPLDARWAALGMRKKSSDAQPRKAVTFDQQMTLADLFGEDVPTGPGLYLIQANERPLYVNAADNLQKQIACHKELAGDELVPYWLLNGVGRADHLAYSYLADETQDALGAACRERVDALHPHLNLTSHDAA